MSTSKISYMQPIELYQRLERGDDICLVDVRKEWEYSLAFIPGSEHIPLNELADRIQETMFEEENSILSSWRKSLSRSTNFTRGWF